jgi:hypothetical protein
LPKTTEPPAFGAKKLDNGANTGHVSVPLINVNKIGKQFYVDAKIFDRKIRFLVDTGSQLNLICHKNVPKNIKIIKTQIEVNDYSGGKIDVYGKVEAEIFINDVCWGKSIFYVVSNHLSQILGVPALIDNEILINLKSSKMIQAGPVQRFCQLNQVEVVRDEKDVQKLKAFSTTTLTFKAKSEILIDLEIENLDRTMNLFFEKSNLGESKLQILPSFQTVKTADPKFRILVINPTETSIKIPAGTTFVYLFEIVEIAQIKNKPSENINNIKVGNIASQKIKKEFFSLVNKFSYLFLDSDDPLPACNIEKFSITTDSLQPISTHPYRTPFSIRKELKSILDKFVENKLIEPCSSPWNSPSLLVRKKDGKFRLVIDYRRLNDATLQMHHPLPNLEDSVSYLENSRIFSMCDMIKGFHQIDLEESSKDKTAFSNEFGQFRFLRMPMGCKNSPSFFMRVMDRALMGIEKTEIIAYMDDLLCHSRTEEEHLISLTKFFTVLSANNLRINSKKAEFFTNRVTFCGFDISYGNVAPSTDKIKAIRHLKIPRSRDEAQSLFGALNYHRKFIKNFASIAFPISKTYRATFSWTDEASKALEILKDIICNHALNLKIPPANEASFVLETDASDLGYGGVLYVCEKERDDAHTHNSDCLTPVCYNSGNFSDVQTRYSIIEKELLSGKLCMEKWSIYLAFREFDWITDNANIKYVRTLRTNNQKIVRWITEIQGFSFRMIQRPSAKMKISDFLSRQKPEINAIKFKKSEFSELQKHDEILGSIYKFLSIDRWPNNPKGDISFYALFRSKIKLTDSGEIAFFEDNGSVRICVPKELEKEIIEEYHNYCHSGVDQTFSRISKKYIWPRMNQAIRDFIKTCDFCQKDKPNFHPNRAPVLSFKTPDGPYQVYGFDLITLPPTDAGNKYVLVMIDFFSKFGFCEPLKSRNSNYLLTKFKNIIFKNPFYPKYVVLDNAREHSELAKFMKENDIEPHFTPPRHPASNGQVENYNRTLKSRLRAKCNYVNWDLVLQEVVHDLNSAEHSVTKQSPFSIQSGVRNPHNIYDPNFRDYRIETKIDFEKIKERIDLEKNNRLSKFSNPKFSEYQIDDLVLIKNFDSKKPKFLGPFKIIDKSKAGTWYTVKSDKQTFRRHAEHLKKYFLRQNDQAKSTDENSYQIKTDKDFGNLAPKENAQPNSGFFIECVPVFDEEINEKLDNFSSKILDKISSDIFTEFLLEAADLYDDSSTESHKVSSTSLESSSTDKLEIRASFSESNNQNSPTENEIYQTSGSEYEFETNSGLLEITTDSISDAETILEGNLEPVHLQSYDELDITENRKRAREASDGSASRPKMQIIEKKPSAVEISPSRPKSNRELKRTNLLVKFENEHPDFFSQLDEKYGEIEPNMMIENGFIIKLGELQKDMLQYICSNFNIKFEEKMPMGELRIGIREYISYNHPNWRKSTSGEYLFFSKLNLKGEQTLSDLSKTELKVLVAQYQLPKSCLNLKKSLLIEFIDEYFAVHFPHHPRKLNDLIFGPNN